MKAIKISFKTKKLKINTSVWQRRGKKKEKWAKVPKNEPSTQGPAEMRTHTEKCTPHSMKSMNSLMALRNRKENLGGMNVCALLSF